MILCCEILYQTECIVTPLQIELPIFIYGFRFNQIKTLISECFSKKIIWCITDFVPLLMFPFPASHYIAGRMKGMAPTTFFVVLLWMSTWMLHTSTALSLSVLKVAWREVKSPRLFAVSPQSTSNFHLAADLLGSTVSSLLFVQIDGNISLSVTRIPASVYMPAKVVSEPSVLSQLRLNVRMLCFHCHHPSNRCNSQLSGQLQDAEFKVKVENCPREPPREIWMYLGQQPRRNLTVQQTKRRTVEPRRHYIMQIVLGGR